MGKMEQTLKSEIVRLAKKQLRATCVPLAREVRQLKRTVSQLRKTVAFLAPVGAQLQAQKMAEMVKLRAAPEEIKAARISPGLIKKLRARLGITQGELATLVGVSTSAVGFWEYGKAWPVRWWTWPLGTISGLTLAILFAIPVVPLIWFFH